VGVIRVGAALLLLLAASGCARDTGTGTGAAQAPPSVRVQTGTQDVRVQPSQYCLDGERKQYDERPPIIEAPPGSPISLTVPAAVAERGWSVQVFDDKLATLIGEVDVPKGERTFSRISSSDVVPPAFYLVAVEAKGGACGPFSGAWPVGFIRPDGTGTGAPSSGTPQG